MNVLDKDYLLSLLMVFGTTRLAALINARKTFAKLFFTTSKL